MFYERPHSLPRSLTLLVLCLTLTQPSLRAASAAPANPSAMGSQSAMQVLINRLAARGLLTKQDSADLQLLAEADAAEVQAQAAMTQAALARANAAEARARAMAAMMSSQAGSGTAVAAAPEPAEPAEPGRRSVPVRSTMVAPVMVARPDHSPTNDMMADPDVARALAKARAAEPTVRGTEPAFPEAEPRSAEETQLAVAPPPARPSPAPVRATSTYDVPPAADMAAAAEPVGEDVVRVTYVPEIVKAQLREEIKQEVLAQARDENWASPRTFPDWVLRVRLFGDVRVRGESQRLPDGNDNTGAFPNFNAINTGSPFDVAGTIFSPQFNVDQDRNRVRLRARGGLAVDLDDGFTLGLRIATGENNSPVTQNQSLGAAGSGQGGNFSKYAIWLDRGFLRYETGGLPDEDLMVTVGRFDNPFMSTTLLWADDLGFDGLAVQGRVPTGEDITPFFTAGAFPIFNTDLNYATNQPSKFKSRDKWLYAGQLGATWEITEHVSLKLAVGYNKFQNVEGELSTPFVPISTADAGDTDASRPAFAQKGNTYMALRDITPSPLNSNGTINQFQYFGLASKFEVMTSDARLDFNPSETFQVSLIGEYAKNRGYERDAIEAKAVNNLAASATSTGGIFIGGDTAWMVNLQAGAPALKHRWDWTVNLGYRKVESDAVVDGFNDSDFGGGGTNVKGLTFGGTLAISSHVWLGLRWFSATQVAGPQLKSDIFQFDLNGKF